MITGKKCMLCDAVEEFEFVHTLRDDDTRNVCKCKKCGHIQILPLPTPEEDDDYYQKDTMSKSIFSEYADLQKEENLMYRYRAFVQEQSKHFEKHIGESRKILDIGTGYGWFVEFMREKGFETDGVELSREKRQLCEQRSGIKLFGWNFLYDVPAVREKNGYYDMVCLMHTLEHISDPKTFLVRAGSLLKPGGGIYIDVPNFEDYMKRELPEYDDFAYSRKHLSYFYPETLTMLLESAGFVDIKIYGHQIYSFENTSWWMREKRPFLDYHQIDVPEQLQWLNRVYKEKIESVKKSHAITCIGYKST